MTHVRRGEQTETIGQKIAENWKIVSISKMNSLWTKPSQFQVNQRSLNTLKLISKTSKGYLRLQGLPKTTCCMIFSGFVRFQALERQNVMLAWTFGNDHLMFVRAQKIFEGPKNIKISCLALVQVHGYTQKQSVASYDTSNSF